MHEESRDPPALQDLLNVSIAELEDLLHGALTAQAGGISEYDLIGQLRERDLFRLPPQALLGSDSLTMFRMHFLVFHALYRLRDRLRRKQSADIDLSPVCIRLLSHQGTGAALAQYDPLYDYYMDLENLADTGADDVDEMLQRFWLRLGNSERRAEALRELELDDPVSDDAIRKQYRRLAMKHHPDRGGEREKLQRINAAMSILINSYRLEPGN